MIEIIHLSLPLHFVLNHLLDIMSTHDTSSSRSENTCEEAKEEGAVQSSAPPDGGLRAWLVAVGGFLTYFATFGDDALAPLHSDYFSNMVNRTVELVWDIPDLLPNHYSP